jgi:thioredoxin-like negative regulator of GroEL
MTPESFNQTCDAVEGYLALGMTEQAWELLDHLPSEAKSTVAVVSLQMAILAKGGQYQKASFLAESLCQMQPTVTEWQLCVAQFRRQAGDVEGALKWLQTASQHCEHLGEYHFLKAQCLVQLGQTDDGKASLKQAMTLDEGLRLQALQDPVLASIW